MMGRIYLIVNSVNGKGYIGQTEKTVARRWIQHKSYAKLGVNLALHRAMLKYGVEKFTIIEIATCDVLFLDDLESHFIKFFNTHAHNGYGYNLTDGGQGPRGCVVSEETKRKLSLALIGNTRSLGRVHSIETRNKMSESHKKNPHAHWKGKRLSAETRAKMSASRMGNQNRLRPKES
jgi:group I intron endonuclease